MHKHFLALFLTLTLAACGSPASKSTAYTAPLTVGGRMCVNQCNEAKNYCLEDCNLTQHQCVSKIQAQALIDYQKYMSEQFTHSDAIEFRARDFERMAPCDNAFKSCRNDCEGHYQDCFETCGGKVETVTSCQLLCF